MPVANLQDLFMETLKDVYYVEKKLVKELPKMIKKASSPQLKDAISGHLEETQIHVTRIEDIFTALNKKPVAKKCEALEGLLEEAEEVIEDVKDPKTLDAALISSAQTVEHYEIARYGTLARWAVELGHDDVTSILEETLAEEKAADSKLTKIAESAVNQAAAAA